MLLLIVLIILILSFSILFRDQFFKRKWKKLEEDFPIKWRMILQEKVAFYNSLDSMEQALFEKRVFEFILNFKITGVKTDVTIEDKLLVASSAIIPLFAFPEWNYMNLDEVLLYPSSFNKNFETSVKERSILGMVGSGFMEGKMILSKNALHRGFANESDKKNTAIHEFIHLLDKQDGSIDGIPSHFMQRQYSIPWIQLMERKIEDIHDENSDINPYGATNKAEFFAVISEYFFERPKLLAQKHPKLYAYLKEIFQNDLKTRELKTSSTQIGRNSACPCNSGKKYKHCCMN